MIPNWRNNARMSHNDDVSPSNYRPMPDITSWLQEHLLTDSEFVMADGLDEAFVGYVENHSTGPVAVYDTNKVLELLEKDMDMTRLEAIEFFNFNIIGSYIGPQTPLFLRRYDTS